MSGGRLVVLDRFGRDAKTFTLAEGSASIGSDPSCDIRVMVAGVRPHHATVQVHATRTLVRAVDGETLLNGAPFSVAALRHGDTLRLGGRSLRWDYERPPPPAAPPAAAAPCLAVPRRGAAARARRRSEPARRALHAPARDSAPASTSFSVKQVAVVQPQRRDTCERNVEPVRSYPAVPSPPAPALARKSFPNKSPRALPLDDPTKASLWIESRRPRVSPSCVGPPKNNSPRSASKSTGTESPGSCRRKLSNISTRSKTDTPKNGSSVLRAPPSGPSPAATPGPCALRESFRGSPRRSLRGAPLRLAVLRKAHSAQTRVTKIRAPLKIDHTKQAAILLMTGHAARPRSLGTRAASPGSAPRVRARASAPASAGTPPHSGDYRTNTPDIKESEKRTPVGGRRSGRQILQSPTPASPKKSALKDPTNKSSRKSESIKFDLSNLDTSSNSESYERTLSSDVVFAEGAARRHTSSTKSPSPMNAVHSRSTRIIEKSLGSPMQTRSFERSTSPPRARLSNRSLRGSIIVQKALGYSHSRYSRRTTKSLSDQSYSTTFTSRISGQPSPSLARTLGTHSIVDLVSVDSDETPRSIYNSVDSHDTASFGTPGTVRMTRSKDSSLLGSSTPYLKKTLSPKPDSHETKNQNAPRNSTITIRRSGSVTTPENTQTISLNSTRISRLSRSRSRVNGSDISPVDGGSSPRSSGRVNQSLSSPIVGKNIYNAVSPSESLTNGTVTPVHGCSPQDVGTPILSIQNLLDRSSVSRASKPAQKSRKTRSKVRRKTVGSTFTEPKKSRISVKSRSINLTGGRSLRSRKTSLGSLNGTDRSQDTEDAVTPKSAVKIVQEAVKNKHSTAKKPHSKRSLIDNLDDSDFVKELFNSPVKRKLSQSMIEFSRKFFNDDVTEPSRPSRSTGATTGRTPEQSLLDNTQAFTPEIFVSPLGTPADSPDLTGLARLFRKNAPRNELRDLRGIKTLLRTPRARKSINDDLCNISGVKKMFGRSPRNRLSDVRVKELFALSPTADYRQVSGVKALFQRSPTNDLRNVTGVRRTLRVNTPRNNLSDVQGVNWLYREQYAENNSSDVSGIEELPDESTGQDDAFDRLLDRPRLRAYTKSNSCGGVDKNQGRKRSTRGARSLYDSIGLITDNVEEWLQNELQKRVQRPELASVSSASGSNVTRELRKLHTDVADGEAEGGASRASLELYSARKLPLKKRSLASPGRVREAALPLKKRAVPHSTPLRAARGLSVSAAELARVSPIAADDPGTLSPPPESPRPRTARGRKPKTAISDQERIVSVKPSPKRTRSKVSRSSPAQTRLTRGRKEKDDKAAAASKGQSTVVVAKKPFSKSPVASPKITRTKKGPDVSNIVNRSKKIGSARQKPEIKTMPRKARSKLLKETTVVSKPSPPVMPRSRRQIKKNTENIQLEGPKRVKIATISKNNDKGAKTKKELVGSQQPEQTEPLKVTRGRKNAAVDIEAIHKEEVPVKKRGRKTQEVPNITKTSNKRKRKLPDSLIRKSIDSQPNKTSRGKIDNKILSKSGRRKVAISEPSPEKIIKTRNADRTTRNSARGTKHIKDKTETNNTKNRVEKPQTKMITSKKSVAEGAAGETHTDGRKTRKTAAKEEAKPPKAKKAAPARALRKRPSPDPVEDAASESKRRRTGRGAAQGLAVKHTTPHEYNANVTH